MIQKSSLPENLRSVSMVLTSDKLLADQIIEPDLLLRALRGANDMRETS